MSMQHLANRIATTNNPSCIGLDPTPALIPTPILNQANHDHPTNPAQALADAYTTFNRAVIDGIADIAPAVKLQIAMYEALGPVGVEAYAASAAYAHERGLYVIGDIKRGDIGSTAAQYAHHLTGTPTQPSTDPWHENAVTINPYLGEDGIRPFYDAAKQAQGALFCLVHTSNPSAAQLQELKLADGTLLYEHVGRLIDQWNTQWDTSGSAPNEYGIIGAVIGATYPQQGAHLRALMPHTMFLVPGYGAQGGSAANIAPMFDHNGQGVIVNSSRGIIGAWREHHTPANTQEAVSLVTSSSRQAAIAMQQDLTAVIR